MRANKRFIMYRDHHTLSLFVAIGFLHLIFCESLPNFPTFTTGYENKTLTKIAVDNDTGQIYVGGKNALYRLTAGLDLLQTIVIGPKNESVDRTCKPFERDCIFSRNNSFKSTDNHVSIIQMYKKENFFLVCETLHNGLCYIQTDKMDLTRRRHLSDQINFLQNNLLGSRNNVAIIVGNVTEPGNTNQFFRDNLHFVARSYDGRPTSLFHTHEFSTLKLSGDKGSYTFKEYLRDRSFLQVRNEIKDSFTLRIIFGYETKDHVYFVFVRSADGSRVVETKVARICKRDRYYYSYIEIAIWCKNVESHIYRLATAGHYHSANDTLYVAFGSRTHRSETYADVSEGSILCSYTQRFVDSRFNAVRHQCYTGYEGIRPSWMEMDKHPGQACKNQGFVSFKDFCGSRDQPGIEGQTIGIMNYLVPTFKFPSGKIITAIYVTSDPYSTIFLGTNDGYLIKLELTWASYLEIFEQFLDTTGRQYAEYDVTGNRSVGIKSDLVLDPEGEHIYLLSGNRITKVPLFSCALHTQCGPCISNSDPLNCGWCGEACTSQYECQLSGFTWYSNSCPPVISKVLPSTGPISGNTSITIYGDDFGSMNTGAVDVSIGGDKCLVTYSNNTIIVCKSQRVGEEKNVSVSVIAKDTSRTVKSYNIDGVSNPGGPYFMFLIPYISKIHPVKGPALGKSLLTITGDNLDIGANVMVYVSESDNKCAVTQQNKSAIVCRLSTYIETTQGDLTEVTARPMECEGYGPVDVHIDDTVLVSDDSYCYLPDPVVSEVEPRETIQSGGLQIYITGENLDTCSSHSLVFTLSGQQPLLSKDCHLITSTLLMCEYPSLMLTTASHGSVYSGKMTVLMDNFTDFDDGDWTFKVYDDPLFYHLSSDTSFQPLKKNKQELLLKGERLDLVLAKEDYEVMIYKRPCPVLKLTSTYLTCDLGFVLRNSSDLAPVMEVEIKAAGFNQTIGRIKVDRLSQGDQISSRYVMLGAILGGSVFFIVVVLFCILKKKHIGPFKKHLQRFQGTEALEEAMTYQGLMSRIDADEPSSAIPNNYTNIGTEEGAIGGVSLDPMFVDMDTLYLLEKQKLLIDREYLVLGENIGHGQFGCVYKGFLSKPGEKEEMLVAVKTILKSAASSDINIHEFLNEAMIMKDFKHPNVLTLIGVCVDKGEFPLVILPFMENGDLLTYIRDEKNSPRVRDLVSAGLDICTGMEYLSAIKFVHRDLAARNCMLDENMVAKVADFGLSRDIYSSHYYSSDNRRKLPVKWMAPESLQQGKYTAKSDVWSFGVVVWELMTRGASPYNEVDNWDMFSFLKQGRRLPRPMFCPQELYDIMLECWSFHASKRPTFKQLVKSIKSILSASDRIHKVGDIMVDLDSATSTG